MNPLIAALWFLCILFIVFGLTGIFAPDKIRSFFRKFWDSPSSMWFAVISRLILGAIFVRYAPESELGQAIRIFGWFLIVAAVALPLIGKERLTKLIHWILDIPTTAYRVMSLVIIGLGVGVYYLIPAVG